VIDWLVVLARSHRGLMLVAVWACAEAILFPVVPDVVLLPLVAAAPRATPRLVLALLAGALVGSAILAAWVLADPGRVGSLLASLPGMDAVTLPAVEAEVAARGASAFASFGPGVPLKVYTTAWIVDGGSPLVLAGAVIVNRITRIGPGLVIAAAIGCFAPRALRRFEGLAIVAYALGWIGLYLVYWRIV
jgi:1-acyl-sn-glycerol-3-phosphate acyltransferase